jgi:predicted NBD/HSP70 family sugar kinase
VIRAQKQVTRAELAAAVGVSQAMGARMAARLAGLGLVRSAGRTTLAQRGRRPYLLEVNPRAGCVAAVNIHTDVVQFFLADLHGDILVRHAVPGTIFDGLSQARIVEVIAGIVRERAAAASIAVERIVALGLAIMGIVDSEAGRCLVRSSTPGWEEFDVAARLTGALDMPVLLEETARAKSIAESRCGAARRAQHFLYVEAGLEIGAGLVVDKRPYRGIVGMAGELGHITIDPAGALCRCGNRGCIQATASAYAVVARARELLSQGMYSSLNAIAGDVTLADIAAAAAKGDKLALSLLTDAGERLGEAISMAMNLLGLDLVVMGGVLAECSPLVLDAARRTMRLRVLPLVAVERTIRLSALGAEAAGKGVILQALDWLFAAPIARILSRGAARPGRLAAAAS